ncbi:YajG family lipoprotein [Campylobacter californiensis]|uniref:YajG family lipoprotein n=1 Tax=Campylobacter californiensis TaxID=1032243 RepID=UPI00147654E7|nr:YajG family lipoprotein [Campylobacter sp. RM12916]MBE3610602.1 hypothetical protein [Campylobacter sp. RM12916]
MKNLKILFAALLALLAFSGCSPTQSVVNLEPYNTKATSKTSYKDVYIANIHDNRKNKSVVATITDSKGSVKEYVMLQNDLASWFNEALTTELKANGANVGNLSGVVAEIYINEFSANMSGFASDNTRGNIKILLKIQKGETTITKNISNEQTKFELIPAGNAFKTLLRDMINDAVKRVAIQILNS